MNSGHLKGALLEYLVRKLLTNCGFTSVKADGIYIYENRGLFFINGKGAAHDADVLMNPPIQMPFSYPSRILFECKAYDKTVGLNVVRNALGLRYDINDFEIITNTSIRQRQNNRRLNYAIEGRRRFNYEVGVAAVGAFSKDCIEFAANNKIPLLSLEWFMDENTIELINSINETYLSTISPDLQYKILHYLKGKRHDSESPHTNREVDDFIENDNIIVKIIQSFSTIIDSCYVGLLETGDLIFLFAEQSDSFELLDERVIFNGLKAQIHYHSDEPNIWQLEISDNFSRDNNPKFKFFIPDRIMNMWKQFSLDRKKAIDIKQEFFSRIFIFSKPRYNRLPFFVVNIDEEWLNEIREE